MAAARVGLFVKQCKSYVKDLKWQELKSAVRITQRPAVANKKALMNFNINFCHLPEWVGKLPNHKNNRHNNHLGGVLVLLCNAHTHRNTDMHLSA
jgi:hypothetical protein